MTSTPIADHIIMEGKVVRENEWLIEIDVGKERYVLRWQFIATGTYRRFAERLKGRTLEAQKWDQAHRKWVPQAAFVRDALIIVAWPRVGDDDVG
jgi:hypothetical protein